jgi:hypothetical protein
MKIVTFQSWAHFQEFVGTRFQNDCSFVFRGHRCENWLLEPTLARLFKTHSHLSSLDENEKKASLERHYNDFQYAMRGRRGEHPPKLDGDYLWALGQHFGLATPLLDWSHSPFVAAFFAFSDAGIPRTKYRAVFAIETHAIEKRSTELRQTQTGFNDHIHFFSPLSDENPRLVNQGGVFSRCPIDLDLETWVERHHDGSEPLLLKLLIPDKEQQTCLRGLSLMNINHLSIFPDLHGASQFCNLALSHLGYSLHMGHPKPARIRMG